MRLPAIRVKHNARRAPPTPQSEPVSVGDRILLSGVQYAELSKCALPDIRGSTTGSRQRPALGCLVLIVKKLAHHQADAPEIMRFSVPNA